MDTFRLGRTGLMVTRIGFGGIPIQRLSEDEAIAVVKRCLALGINFIDTAHAYTTSEKRIGKAIQGQREKVILATKSESRDPKKLEEHLQLSLKQLGTDYIDLYQFHDVSDLQNLEKVLEPNGIMSVVKDAQARGTIRHIGITSHQIDVAKKAIQTGQFETIMFPFNFITSEAADELLPLCRQNDMGFICMKPLAGGMIEHIEIAFKYLFQFTDVLPIPGIQKISEIEEIVKILEISPKLTRAEQREMKRVKKALGSKFCHRCDYCQPCTKQIPISVVMNISGLYKRMPLESFFSHWVKEAMDKAAECSKCGECEERCPFHLPIRDMIEEQVAWYQDLREKYVKS